MISAEDSAKWSALLAKVAKLAMRLKFMSASAPVAASASVDVMPMSLSDILWS